MSINLLLETMPDSTVRYRTGQGGKARCTAAVLQPDKT
jgi:hypothetical protein